MIAGAERAHRVTPRGGRALSATAACLLGGAAIANAAPPIRTSATNPVPACVTPDRLMAFLKSRNPAVDKRFARIAEHYRSWGEAWRVRWDYAFFQMAIETNFLSYRRGDGRPGDVNVAQNNFAGIGATGGGVPGDRFPDVATGVHAQIQHLVAYSGERLARPIAPRTMLKQDHIVSLSQRLNRPVTFGDLARRWAVDPHYARSIDRIANQFRDDFCDGASASSAPPRPAQPPLPKPYGLGGPKPSALAGPETPPDDEVLPWAREPVTPAKPQASAPEPAVDGIRKAANRGPAGNAAEQTADKSPVRTIWSRDAAPPVVTPQAVVDVAVAAAPKPTPAAESSGFFGLPLFRIAPAEPPPPSKLGGPIPVPLFDPTDGGVAPYVEPSAPAASQRAEPPCRVLRASYGGRKTLLVQSTIDGQLRLTALTVLDGFEKTMFETYARAAAPGAVVIGEYDSIEAALADARSNCPGG